jgi:putative endonuclease
MKHALDLHQYRQHRALNDALAAGPDAEIGIEMPARPGPSGEPTTTDVGSIAELRAVDLLEQKGLWILERNYRCKVGELDIIALDGDTMVFVEVRSRANDEHGDAIESVNWRKQNKVRRVAEIYLAHRSPPYDEFRFDVVAMNGPSDDDITHYDDAWRGGLL